MIRSCAALVVAGVGTGVDVATGVDLGVSLGIRLAEGMDVSATDGNGEANGVNDKLGLGSMVGSGIGDSVFWGVGVGVGAVELDRAWIALCFVPSYIPVGKIPIPQSVRIWPGRGRY